MDPKIFRKAPLAPIYTNFEEERVPKKRDFLVEIFQKKKLKTPFRAVFQNFWSQELKYTEYWSYRLRSGCESHDDFFWSPTWEKSFFVSEKLDLPRSDHASLELKINCLETLEIVADTSREKRQLTEIFRL